MAFDPSTASLAESEKPSGKSYGTPAKLLDNLEMVESSGNPLAVNKESGAMGAYQFMPTTVEMLKKQGIEFDPFDKQQSREAADEYISKLAARHGGDYEKAMADYGGFVTKDPTEYVGKVMKGVSTEAPVKLAFDPTSAKEFNPATAKEVKDTKEEKKTFGKEFIETLTSESLPELWSKSLPANLIKGIARQTDPNIKGRIAMAKGKLTPLSEIKKEETVPTYGQLLTQAKNFAMEHPGATLAEFAKGVVQDPELLFPVFGVSGGAAKLSMILGKIGAKVTPAAEVAGKVAGRMTGAGAEGAAVMAGISGAEQYAEGEFKPNKLIADTIMGGAITSLLGVKAKDFSTKMEGLTKSVKDGNISPESAADEALLWLEKQAETGDVAKIIPHEDIVARINEFTGVTKETLPLTPKEKAEFGKQFVSREPERQAQLMNRDMLAVERDRVATEQAKIDSLKEEAGFYEIPKKTEPQRVSDGEATQIMLRPGFLRSATDKLRLADFLKEESGSVSPEAAKNMAIAGGAITGGLLASSGDEEDIQAGERFWGAVGGGLSMFALTKLPGMRVRRAQKSVDSLELAIARGMLKGKLPADVIRELGSRNPDAIIAAKRGVEILDKQLSIPKTREEAADVVDFYYSKQKQRTIAIGADNMLGMLSTRIRNESQDIFRMTRDYERQILKKPHEMLNATDPFKEVFKGRTDQTALSLDLFNGKFDSIRSKLTPEERLAFNHADAVINKIGDDLVSAGIMREKIPNYWPRMVRDQEGLLNSFGVRKQLDIRKQLDEANKKSLETRKQPLTAIEESMLLDKYLRGYPIKEYKPGFSKQRKIAEVTEDMLPFYEHPIETLHTYINNSTIAIEKARLFGRDIKYKTVDELKVMDLEASIGGYLQRARKEGLISDVQIPLMKELLNARFGIGEKAPNKILQDWRNITNAGLLGNVFSAGRQAADVGKSLQVNGFKPTLTAVVEKLTGKQEVKTSDWGLTNRVAEEFTSDIASSKFLKTALKWNGFTMMDTGAKDIFFNSSIKKASTPKGQKYIVEKYREMLPEKDLVQLLQDVRNNKKSDLVHEYLFNELNDIQPLTKLETTKFGLENPNARILYQLKSFMLKQGDDLRVNAYNKIRDGKIAQGLQYLTSYMLIIGSTQSGVNAAIDWAMGRDPSIDALDIPLGVFKMFGLNDYNLNKIREGKLVDVASSMVIPPIKAAQSVINLDKKSIQYLPGMRPVYEHLLGGKEAWEKKEESKQRKEENN